MNTTFNELGKKFGIAGTVCSYEALNGGLINYTWKVTFVQDDLREKDYIFQGINTFVFKHPKEMMCNIGRVTEYLCETYPDQASLRFYKTEDGMNYWIGEDDMFWRAADYVDSVTFDVTEDLAVVEAAGKAFGQFQAGLRTSTGPPFMRQFRTSTIRRSGLTPCSLMCRRIHAAWLVRRVQSWSTSRLYEKKRRS